MATLAHPGALLSADLSTPAARRVVSVRGVAAGVMLVGAFVLLFARLGTYSLWTDEASTAITARGVWHTGDTTAWLNDHNLLTYRNGLLLKHQKDRYTSPLQFYVAAPFIGLIGDTAFACRLPFALCGMATVGLMVLWLWRSRVSEFVWVAATLILFSCASFFLFQRQCRYYALATLLSTVVGYLYCHWDGSRRQLLGIGATMALLLASQYLDYAAVVGCLLIDYGIWGRRRRAIRGTNWLVLILPQLLTAAIVCPIWNPIARATDAINPAGSPVTHAAITAGSSPGWLGGFATMFWWNLRDLLACDFAILPLLALCPLLYLKRKDVWLLRAPLALVVFLGAIAFFTAHPVAGDGNAEVRYLAPLLPLCIASAILAVAAMQSLRVWQQGMLLMLAVLSQVIAPATGKAGVVCESSAISYLAELWQPATEPYTPLAQWINANIPTKATVYLTPDWCVSPTMWDAPRPTYVWQLTDPPGPDYRTLPGIYFKGRIPPDYLIGFGPYRDEIKDLRSELERRGVFYEPVATLPVFWKEMVRPEMIWRSFSSNPAGKQDELYIFRRRN